jgi:hypothetical protein
LRISPPIRITNRIKSGNINIAIKINPVVVVINIPLSTTISAETTHGNILYSHARIINAAAGRVYHTLLSGIGSTLLKRRVPSASRWTCGGRFTPLSGRIKGKTRWTEGRCLTPIP